MTPETPSTAEPLFSTLASDPDLRELVEMYVDEMPDRLAALQEKLASTDWEELRRLAHQMKGAAGSYGFDPITPVAGTVEDSIRNDAPEEQIRRAVEDLLAICSRVRAGTVE
ncbi:MAG: Hpt domain-containing protein [Pirellulales bacterium]|nr:Hpt domain-containing protein [Pirellulales bacterium]